mgnify:CR=1 FL=1
MTAVRHHRVFREIAVRHGWATQANGNYNCNVDYFFRFAAAIAIAIDSAPRCAIFENVHTRPQPHAMDACCLPLCFPSRAANLIAVFLCNNRVTCTVGVLFHPHWKKLAGVMEAREHLVSPLPLPAALVPHSSQSSLPSTAPHDGAPASAAAVATLTPAWVDNVRPRKRGRGGVHSRTVTNRAYERKSVAACGVLGVL